MIKNIILIVILVGLIIFLGMKKEEINPQTIKQDKNTKFMPEIYPVEHASFVITWDEQFIFNDPVGEIEQYSEMPTPHLILLSDIHGDHLNVKILEALVGERSTIVAPQAVADILSPTLLSKTTILKNGEAKIFNEDFLIEAIPMYNLPESIDSKHTKGRGNGYLISKNGIKVYIAGDTAGVPEMRALKDIDIAFIPMNLPYTMSVEEAANAVLEFEPKQVIPYHYRTPEGLSDVSKFQELVNTSNPNIEVLLLNWYSKN